MSWNINLKTLYQYTAITGAFIMCLPVGVVWLYGNLSPYLLSYFLYAIGPEAFDVQADWLLSTFLVMNVISLLTVDWCVKKIGTAWTLMVAFLCFDLSLFLTYFTVQLSVGLTLVTFMLIGGFTAGQVTMVSLMYASKVAPEHVGAATAFISSGFGLGAIFLNVIITAFINPDNLSPDVRQAGMVYFSQPHVLHKVPGVFIVLGITALGLHLLGFLMEILPLYVINTEENSPNGNEIIITEKSVFSKGHYTGLPSSTDESVDSEVSSEDTVYDQKPSTAETSALKPYEMIRTKSFYQLWVSLVIISFSNLLVQNFYKLFGQLWIRDDSFLALVGSMAAVVMSLYRIIIGFIMDKIGVKNTIMMTLFLNAVLMSFWYVTPQIDRWLYVICFQALAAVQGSMFTVFPISVVKLFGPTYYATNYGLLMTANIFASLVSPSLYPIIRESVGWFGLMLVASVGSLLALLSLVIAMPPDNV